jgi:hypothetical protein
MANEFVTKNGLISQNNVIVSGSLTVTQDITGSAVLVTGSTGTLFTANIDTLTLTGSLLVTGSVVITGSLSSSGAVYFSTLTTSSVFHIVMYNTSSGQLYFTASSAVGGSTFNSTSSIIGNGLSSSFNVNHGFNTRNLHITVYESGSNGETVYPDIRRINANTASIIFANPPASNEFIVYISQ